MPRYKSNDLRERLRFAYSLFKADPMLSIPQANKLIKSRFGTVMSNSRLFPIRKAIREAQYSKPHNSNIAEVTTAQEKLSALIIRPTAAQARTLIWFIKILREKGFELNIVLEDLDPDDGKHLVSSQRRSLLVRLSSSREVLVVSPPRHLGH